MRTLTFLMSFLFSGPFFGGQTWADNCNPAFLPSELNEKEVLATVSDYQKLLQAATRPSFVKFTTDWKDSSSASRSQSGWWPARGASSRYQPPNPEPGDSWNSRSGVAGIPTPAGRRDSSTVAGARGEPSSLVQPGREAPWAGRHRSPACS